MIPPLQPELAYIGPGAGFAFLGSFLSILGGVLLGMVSFLLWPVRVVWGAITGRQGYKHAKVKKLVFLGLDGLDPGAGGAVHAGRQAAEPSRLREQGGFHRLRTTFPALSPVAWSTFATGVNPARHAMFDFLNRSLSSYMPYLSSSRVSQPAKILKLGKYRIPLGAPDCGDAAQEQDVLADPGAAADRFHHPARADHVSAGEVQRPSAFRHVYAGPVGHAGHLRAVHHPNSRWRDGERQPVSPWCGTRRCTAARFKGRPTRCTRRRDPWKSHSHSAWSTGEARSSRSPASGIA